MSTTVWTFFIVAAVLGGFLAGWLILRKRRTAALREQFGPEYQHTVEQQGNRKRAETVLQARENRVEQLHIKPLSRTDRSRFMDDWRGVQSSFVDDPKGASDKVDRLIGEVMQMRGYPVGDFEQRAADISVDHPKVVQNYREAHQIAQRNDRGEASTEDLRKAMVHYRELFEELLETSAAEGTEVHHP